MEDSREMVKFIYSNLDSLESLVTYDESWVYCYDPETKRQSAEWKHFDCPRPKKAGRSKSIAKLMMIHFFDSNAMV